MIQKLIIKNFRNLSLLELNFKDKTSIISGKNELGKSNALNALCWLLTNTILTDKWGSGENDIDSIIPNGAIRGINPEVAICFEKGEKFSKKYVSKWSRDGSKVVGHTTEFYVNDVACNETSFKEQLYPKLDYKPALKTKEVNELRLFTDPLYALQKLDNKSLRALLVDLGCSVSDEELYKLGFEDLRPYGDKYMGKWDVFRKKLKDQTNELTKEIESLMAKLETVSNIDDFDDSYLKELNTELESLITKKANLKNNIFNDEVNALEKEIAVLKNTINTKVSNHNNDISNKRSLLYMKRQTMLDKLNHENDLKVNPIREEIGKIRTRSEEISNSIKAYTIAINQNQSLMTSYIDLGKKNNAEKAQLAIKLDIAMNRTYDKLVTCPVCGSEFVANPEEEQAFDIYKQEEINTLMENIEECEKKNKEYKSKFEECKKLKDDAFSKKEFANGELLELNNKMQQLESQKIEVELVEIDMTEINKIDAEIQALNNPVDITEDSIKLNELNAKLESIKASNEKAIEDEVNNIEIAINDLNEKISQEYIKKSKNAEKLEFEESLAKAQAQLNDNDSLLARCNKLINTMISKINEKATAITGLKFVMLEENLTNDGVKEVCYAIIDGIPFKDVNTAKKLKYGIKFIEKMKSLLGHNEFPILADRMEGIDDINKIRELTNEQLICTRVGTHEEITIL